MARKIKVIVVKPDEEAYISKGFDISYSNVSEVLECFPNDIEVKKISDDGVSIIRNKYAKAQGRKQNRALRNENRYDGAVKEIIYGTFLVVWASESGNLCSLSRYCIKDYLKLFKYPEVPIQKYHGGVEMIRKSYL